MHADGLHGYVCHSNFNYRQALAGNIEKKTVFRHRICIGALLDANSLLHVGVGKLKESEMGEGNAEMRADYANGKRG